MGALGKDDKDSLGVAHYPDPMFLLESSVHPKAEI
jgi:hypothetical protein